MHGYYARVLKWFDFFFFLRKAVYLVAAYFP